MSQLRQSSLQEINRIILDSKIKQLSIPASSYEYVTTIAHPYGKAPYYDYDISFDGSIFVPGPRGQGTSTSNENIFMYTDSSNIYFHYIYSGSSGAPSSVLTIYVRYSLYLTEAVK